MLFHPAHRIFAAVLPLVAICSASSSDTSGNNLGPSLWNVIPECATTCVENFANTEYTSAECSSISDVECLCRTETPSGLTIGEAALSCVYALCSETVVQSSSVGVYRICGSVSGAIAETHKTITATIFPSVLPTTTTEATTTDSAAATTQTSDSVSTTTTQSTTSEASSAYPTITINYPGTGVVPAVVSTEIPSLTSTSSSSSGTSTATGNKKDHHVGAGTVIGVSVVSGVAGSFIVGVAVFFLCKRWRRNNGAEDPDSDFEIGGAMATPPGFSQPSSRSSTPRPGPGSGSTLFGAGAHRREMTQSSSILQPGSRPPRLVTPDIDDDHPEPRGRKHIGLAASTDSEWEASPRTLSSQATLSELLPNQGSELYPKPLKWTHRRISEETLFEEDEFQQGVIERRQDAAHRSGSRNVMTRLPANPRAFKDGSPAPKSLRAPGQQQPSQSRNLTPDPTTRGLAPPSACPPFSGSDASNSSSTPIDSSGGDSVSNTSGTHSRPDATTPTPSGTLGPPVEIVSRPRIVRGEDIKRVQIRSSPGPSEAGTPWGPDDLWLERGRGRDLPASSSEVPYPSEVNPGTVVYPSSPNKRLEDASKRVSPTSRKLTPSRRGQDLILRVD